MCGPVRVCVCVCHMGVHVCACVHARESGCTHLCIFAHLCALVCVYMCECQETAEGITGGKEEI